MDEKKAYITTAIPYVNGKPHIGHALDYTLADIWSRYQKQNGRTVRFQVGTDEHGNKIAAKAAENNMTPQAYVDGAYVNFEKMIRALNVEYTDFIRTSNPAHMSAVQYIWQKLVPYIYKNVYEGWYCQGCESFVTDKEAADNNGVCPDHQTSYQRISEENYYFKTSAFTDKIRAAIEAEEMKIIPEARKNEFLELIKNGLADVSISRPTKSLSWGVPVPGDSGQVMYVWIDALSNYITVLGYPNDPTWAEYWPADVQVIGKDILRFHAGIWPAMLLALGLPLPKTLLVHGFVSVGGTKMSKTIGNGVDPMEIIENFGADAFRYYFTRHVPTQDDGDFTWEKFESAYNSELGNDLGNLVQRVASMIVKYQAGVIGEGMAGEHDTGPYHEAMESFQYNLALDIVWESIRSTNQYIDRVKPWEIAKKKDSDPEEAEHLSDVLTTSVRMLLQIADQLAPFMPTTSSAIYGLFENNLVPADFQPLFPKRYLHTADPRVKSD